MYISYYRYSPVELQSYDLIWTRVFVKSKRSDIQTHKNLYCSE